MSRILYVTKCAHTLFTESSFHSWSLYSYIPTIHYRLYSSYRQVIRVLHEEIAL